MRDDLKEYYDTELRYLNTLAQEFAAKYPKIAARLQLGADPPDPHVERLVEACAFLAARVRLKIDDEFPEITEALLEELYPHYVRPIPSMSVVEFHLDPEAAKLTTGLEIKRESVLNSPAVDRVRYQFRTCYHTTLWPVSVAEAAWTAPERLDPPLRAPEAVAVLRIDLRCFPDVQFAKLAWRFLRFYLHGESGLIHNLYELVCNQCAGIVVRDPASRQRQIRLPADALRPVGFDPQEEGVLPYPRRSFLGYRLLQEYFAFPEKFFFLDLGGLEQLGAAGFRDRAEILLLISRFERADRQQALEVGVSAKTLRLNCCPVINLFPHTAEPITVDHLRHEYEIKPDVRRRHALEIFSIEQVVTPNPRLPEIPPLYSFRHAASQEGKEIFYYLRRRSQRWRGEEEAPKGPGAARREESPELCLALVDLTGRPAPALGEVLTVKCLCTNRDWPSRLPVDTQFELEGMPSIKRVIALKKPTPTLRPHLGDAALWRLVSQLSLNYLSLVSEGKEALQEILRLYNFTGSPHLEKQIQGIVKLEHQRHFARVVSENGISFVRGTRVEMLFDEEQFVGGGVYLFASVLEHFLGLYVSLNSFSQLVARTEQRKEVLREWPPRAGQSILL
jgi:type VI secretion system protein ImpG